jgi:predicted nucleic-acid-binding protein
MPQEALASTATGGRSAVEFLDTNPVIRYLVSDDPDLAGRATALIESERRLAFTGVTVAEIGFVLTSVYRVERTRVVDTLIDLLSRENLDTHEAPTEIVIQALRFCQPRGRVNFADAMLWAVARATAPAHVWTFHRRFPEDGIERREPEPSSPPQPKAAR